MVNADKIKEFLSFGLKDKLEESVLNRILIINTFGVIALITLILFSIVTFFEGDNLIAALNLFLAAIVISNFLYVTRSRQYSTAAHILVGVISFYLLFQLIVGTGGGSVIFWFNIIPLASIITLGLRRGTIISGIFLLLTAFIVFLPDELLPHNSYTMSLKLRFLSSYIVIYLIAYTWEFYKLTNLRNLERSLIEEKNENKIKEEFISRLSHQIRTPLNNIILIGEMVSRENLTHEQKDLMETILASASNLTNVVENISAVSSFETRGRPAVNVNFNLFKTISNTLKLFTGEKSSSVNIILDYDSSIPGDIIGDPVIIKQIFLNLIDTIIKRKPSGPIAIKLVIKGKKPASNKVEILFDLITNKPVNIPLAETTYRFNAPRELAVSNISEYINLVELTIAKKLIEQNNSKLFLKTTPDKSLIFSFSLVFNTFLPEPELARDQKQSEEVIIIDSEKKILKYSVELKDSNVLLVEDNMVNQQIIMHSLRKLVKNIDVAFNGKEALDKFGTSKYDIILMDVQMPVMDGIHSTRKIREIESGTGTHTPIIAITANALHGDRDLCYSAGMDDYIAKPFHMELLIERMRRLLTRK